MKRVLALCIALVMVVGMSLPAFAALGGFISSPGGNKGPELVEYDNENHECTAVLIVTPYAERHTLSEEKREELEGAYAVIVNSTDITDLNTDLADLAAKKNLDSKKLAVSDLFDASYYSCDIHDEHGAFTITVKPESLQNFVGLLHLYNGEWELIDNAKVETKDGAEVLTFTVDDLSPFAIVVNTDANPPQTSDNFQWIFYIALMVVSASAMIFIGFKLKKQED
ncbi:MAG: hypothetical protein IJW62_07015 [Clostridia bacterium]|nr:hypothetical protein [Clostridia bacterium]